MSLGEWNGFRLRLAQAACLKDNWSHLVFVCFFFFPTTVTPSTFANRMFNLSSLSIFEFDIF